MGCDVHKFRSSLKRKFWGKVTHFFYHLSKKVEIGPKTEKRKICGNLKINENLIFCIQQLRASIFIVFANDFLQNEDFANINPI